MVDCPHCGKEHKHTAGYNDEPYDRCLRLTAAGCWTKDKPTYYVVTEPETGAPVSRAEGGQ